MPACVLWRTYEGRNDDEGCADRERRRRLESEEVDRADCRQHLNQEGKGQAVAAVAAMAAGGKEG